MSSSGQQQPIAAESNISAHDTTTIPHQDTPSNSNPVEMSSLEDKPDMSGPAQEPMPQSPDVQSGSAARKLPPGPTRTDTTTALAQASSPPSPPPPMPSIPAVHMTSSAIGPSLDQLVTPAKDEEGSGPKLQVTLLLTNGARHPFMLDTKYLAKRNVDVPGNDPYNLSVYKLKELILREWREEWENKPTNPSYIRLISFGRLLDDKAALKDQRLQADLPNVLHMTIKPQDFIDEEDGGKGAKASYSGHRDGTEGRSPGCRCVIM